MAMSSEPDDARQEPVRDAQTGDMDAGDPTAGLNLNGELPDDVAANSRPENSGPAGDVGPGGGSAGPDAEGTRELLPDTPSDSS